MGDRVRAIALVIAVSFSLSLALAAVAAAQTRYGLGRPADPALIERENIDVAPDGAGLPPGSGTAREGASLFQTTCARCHGTFINVAPDRWAYATSLFDYVRRAMPPTHSTTLSPHELYALVAFLLAANGYVRADETLDAKTLTAVHLPRVRDFRAAR
jgi:cytochrome c